MPELKFIAKLGDDMLRAINTHGGIALFILLLIEESGIPMPLPGDILLLYAGVLFAENKLSLFHIFFWSTLGILGGATILFFVFDKGGRAFAYAYGKYILLPKQRIHKLESFFEKHGKQAVLIGRFIPGLRVFASAVAGLAGTLSYPYFILQVFLASIVWMAIFVGIGVFLGRKYLYAVQKIESYGYILFIIFIAIIIFELLKNRKEETVTNT